MFFVRTFQSNGCYKLGTFSSLVISDLKTVRGIIRRVEQSGLDTRLGYDIEQVPDSNPYAPSYVVHRSPRAVQLFGELS